MQVLNDSRRLGKVGVVHKRMWFSYLSGPLNTNIRVRVKEKNQAIHCAMVKPETGFHSWPYGRADGPQWHISAPGLAGPKADILSLMTDPCMKFTLWLALPPAILARSLPFRPWGL